MKANNTRKYFWFAAGVVLFGIWLGLFLPDFQKTRLENAPSSDSTSSSYGNSADYGEHLWNHYEYHDPEDESEKSEEKSNSDTAEPNIETAPAAEPETTTPSASAEPAKPSEPATTPVTTPTIIHNSCLHEEAGRCYDDMEDEMYSAGLYDAAYGWYGASFMPDNDCDDVCQDILEDVYAEGFYDY
ncbi:hypothetical protein IJ135_01350 [Candidatus Saccharibacteria bacterium]|nr:hypothetical protein [Candidatus Saccharibacteria bacterium]